MNSEENKEDEIESPNKRIKIDKQNFIVKFLLSFIFFANFMNFIYFYHNRVKNQENQDQENQDQENQDQENQESAIDID